MVFLADTCLIIDYERERKRATPGKAYAHFQKYPDSIHRIPFIVLGELSSGILTGNRNSWEKLFYQYPVIKWDKEISWQYGRIFRNLRSEGQLIGANDLWIAATALVYAIPVVTRNIHEFSRIPELEVIGY